MIYLAHLLDVLQICLQLQHKLRKLSFGVRLGVLEMSFCGLSKICHYINIRVHCYIALLLSVSGSHILKAYRSDLETN